MTVDELFERDPVHWGLRGDPHVWRAMHAALRGKPLPDDVRAASQLFRKTFRKIVGVDIPAAGKTPEADSIYLKKFATGSGTSDGRVSLLFWRDTAIEILLDRFVVARAIEDPSDRFGLS